MRIGSIVYQKKLVFYDGTEDIKSNRPCIFLYEEVIDNERYSYIMPITSNISSFNRHYKKHVFIPETIYNYKKLSFAKIDGILKVPSEKIIPTDQRLSDNTIKNIIRRMDKFEPSEKAIKEYNDIKYTLKYLEPEVEEKQKQKSKKLKKAIY